MKETQCMRFDPYFRFDRVWECQRVITWWNTKWHMLPVTDLVPEWTLEETARRLNKLVNSSLQSQKKA